MDENKSTGMEECEIRHKYRSAKEEKDLISRLNRIEGQVRGVTVSYTHLTLPTIA